MRVETALLVLTIQGIVAPSYAPGQATISMVGDSSARVYKFKVIREPLTSANVLFALGELEELIRRHPTHMIPHRAEYVGDFTRVLNACDQQDKYRHSRAKYSVDSDKVALEEPPLLHLSLRTVARIVRCFGDLRAEEASGTLARFLLVPSEVTWDEDRSHDGIPHLWWRPTAWAMCQIGEACVPSLQENMTADDPRVRRQTAVILSTILGTKGPKVLRRMMAEAGDDESRERLVEHRILFTTIAEVAKSDPNFRDHLLATGREALSRGRYVRASDDMEMMFQHLLDQ